MKSTHATALAPTAAHDPLLDLPLSRLLAEYGVELRMTEVDSPGVFGEFREYRDGHRILAMPPNRSEFERDTVARMLLADGLGLGGPPVPSPLEVTRV
ncbi:MULTISPECIES: hypothetical protein [unclassified Streptomyces]|uniref:hypothetical protein n=1 Tax=unclassified Streptomyces TaxID=2593676 RepID=UPI00278C74AB|nr:MULTISPECIES: hypothetical protein [unclassified Streptomyces]